MKPCRIVIFAKAPVPGAVKTRLVPALGPIGAARLAQQMLIHTVRQALAAELGVVELCVSPSPNDPIWSATLPRGLRTRVHWEDQGSGDLGAKLARAAERVICTGEAALLVGTDCPALTATHLREAAHLLHWFDAVLAPSVDGGYVLLGLQRTHPSLFANIAWSTPIVAETTRARFRLLGWRWAEQPPLQDIDEPGDLAAVPPAWLAQVAKLTGCRTSPEPPR